MTRGDKMYLESKISYSLLITKVVAVLDSPATEGPKSLDDLGMVFIEW